MTKMVGFLYFNVYFTAPYEKCDTTGRVSVTGNYTRNLERFKLTCRQTSKQYFPAPITCHYGLDFPR